MADEALKFVAGFGSGFLQGREQRRQRIREDERFRMEKERHGMNMRAADMAYKLSQLQMQMADRNLEIALAEGTVEEVAKWNRMKNIAEANSKMFDAGKNYYEMIQSPEKHEMAMDNYRSMIGYRDQSIRLQQEQVQIGRMNAETSRQRLTQDNTQQNTIELNREQDRLMTGLQRISANMVEDEDGTKRFRTPKDEQQWNAIQARLTEIETGMPAGSLGSTAASNISPFTGGVFQEGFKDLDVEQMERLRVQILNLEDLRDSYDTTSAEWKQFDAELKDARVAYNNMLEATGTGFITGQQDTGPVVDDDTKGPSYREIPGKLGMMPDVMGRGMFGWPQASGSITMPISGQKFKPKWLAAPAYEAFNAFMQRGIYEIPLQYMKASQDVPLLSGPDHEGNQQEIGKYYPTNQRLLDLWRIGNEMRDETGAVDWNTAFTSLFGDGQAFSQSPAADKAWYAASEGGAERDLVAETIMTGGAARLAHKPLEQAGKNILGTLTGLAKKKPPVTPRTAGVHSRELHGGQLGVGIEKPGQYSLGPTRRGGMGTVPKQKPAQGPPPGLGVPQGPLPVPPRPALPSVLGVGEAYHPVPPQYIPPSQAGVFNPALPQSQFGGIQPDVLRTLGLVP